MNRTELAQRFQEKAENVSAVVVPVSSPEEAFRYAVQACVDKEQCQLLISGCDENLSEAAEDLCVAKAAEKVLAAPALSPEHSKALAKACEEAGIAFVDTDMRAHWAGVDIGFTYADFGIAETGSLVIDSTNEDLRLSTMISEIHVALLPMSKLRAASEDVERELFRSMQDAPNFTAFITGPSRTADIERVLALGVHGPLELHICLWEDDHANG